MTKTNQSNYIHISTLSPFSSMYAYLDVPTDDGYFAGEIFTEKQIPVKYGKIYVNPYNDAHVVMCKVKKKHTDAFVEAMNQLRETAVKSVMPEYEVACQHLTNIAHHQLNLSIA